MANLVGILMDAEVEEAGNFELLPKAYYEMVVIHDELKSTKAETGKYIAVKLQVVKGKFTGRTALDNINLVNPSQVCQQIGQGTLKRICNLCDVEYPPKDTKGLYGKPMKIGISIDGKYNKVDSYNSLIYRAPAPSPDQGPDDDIAPW